jgi:hypothetical protein
VRVVVGSDRPEFGCEDVRVSKDAIHFTNPPGIHLVAAPTIRMANKVVIVRDGHLLVTVNSGAFQTFFICPGGMYMNRPGFLGG